MTDTIQHQIIYAEKISSGAVVGFEDGVTALYSADLLYSVLPSAFILPPEPEDSV